MTAFGSGLLTEGHGFAGFARPAGVLVAGVLAWRKAPFLVIVLAAAVVMLAALVAITALTKGHGFAGLARPAGVLAGGVLAWRKAPFLVVVIAAAGTTAVLRLLGLP